MEEAIKLIHRQRIACRQLKDLLDELKAALQQKMDARRLREAVKHVESMFGEISRLGEEQDQFLEARQQQNMVSFVQAQPDSVERDVAMRLLFQLGELQKQLSGQMMAAGELLRHSQEFVAFQVNIQTRAKAGDLYGPPGAAGGAHGGSKMFEANV